jgi:hypothetical protein
MNLAAVLFFSESRRRLGKGTEIWIREKLRMDVGEKYLITIIKRPH